MNCSHVGVVRHLRMGPAPTCPVLWAVWQSPSSGRGIATATGVAREKHPFRRQRGAVQYRAGASRHRSMLGQFHTRANFTPAAMHAERLPAPSFGRGPTPAVCENGHDKASSAGATGQSNEFTAS
jgi:hypothetical protein